MSRAVMDRRFRRALLACPERAIEATGLELSRAERGMLSSIPRATLEAAIDRLGVPTLTRRGFLRTASVFTAATAGVAGGCDPVDTTADGGPFDVRPPEDARPVGEDVTISCDGIRPDVPSCLGDGAGDYYVYLYGLTGLLHLPGSFSRGQPIPLCIGFHNWQQSTLELAATWQPFSDEHGIAVLSVRWSAHAEDIEVTAGRVAAIRAILETDYCIYTTGEPVITTGEGYGGAVALSAALFYGNDLSGAISFSSDLPPDWQNRALQSPVPVVTAMHPDDPRYPGLARDVEALAARGAKIQLKPLAGTVGAPAIDPFGAWGWLFSE